MGTEYRIYKRDPREYYDLDKARMEFLPGREPHDLEEQLSKLTADYMADNGGIGPAIAVFSRRLLPLTDPGSAALWSIMSQDGNIRVFRIADWARNDLVDRLYRGSAHLTTLKDAKRVANDLIKWAGTAECALIPDTMIEEGLMKVSFPTLGYRETGSIFSALQ